MMILRYDDDGGGALFLSFLSLCLPPLIGRRRRRKDGLDAIRSAFFAALEFEMYDFLFIADLSLTPDGEACMHDWVCEHRWVVGR